MENLLLALRRNGWRVAVHNDYTLSGVHMTFWLMTHASGIYAKGEGRTDEDALRRVTESARMASHLGVG